MKDILNIKEIYQFNNFGKTIKEFSFKKKEK